MAFKKKIWVNVPDESNLPAIPDGQDSLARFDAENMNRIEAGIEEALSSVGEHTHSKEDVGLGNVPNVTTNDQTPTYTEAATLETLTSGEKLSVAFGKIKKAISSLISHLADTTKHITSTERTTWNSKANASHSHTPSQVGLGNVNNTSDANKPISTAQATAIAEAKKAGTNAQTNLNTHTENKNNPHGVTCSQVGASPSGHKHSANDITSGITPIERGGTGASTAADALSNFGGLPMAGGVMTGPLILSADPTEDMHPATKKYIDNLKGAKFTLLWENSSPSSSFANQTLTITGITNYDYLFIEIASESGWRHSAGIVPATIGRSNSSGTDYSTVSMTYIKSTDWCTYYRPFRVVDANSIYFQEGYWMRLTNKNGFSMDYDSNNSSCVPIKIYGVKL